MSPWPSAPPPASSGEPLQPIGIVLAGGAGRRLGGDKALARLGPHPLIAYPLQALRGVLRDVAVVAKAATALPPAAQLGGAEVWREPDEPRHPLVGILHALERAGGRSIVVCAIDLPFVTSALLRDLAFADACGTPAVLVTGRASGLQPLLGRYEPQAAALLGAAADGFQAPLRRTVAAIGPRLIPVDDDRTLFNVNDPGDLSAAGRLVESYPNVKS
jgi:molybdopterin-guanine dinucleotide biosynthesis protein A